MDTRERVADIFEGIHNAYQVATRADCLRYADAIMLLVDEDRAELVALAVEVAKEYPDAADWKDARGKLLKMARAALGERR